MKPQRHSSLALALAALAGAAAAQDAPQQQVVISATPVKDEPFATRLGKAQLSRASAVTGDSARLLQDIPGVSLYGAGGLSSLPVIRGLADDRLRTQVDGMDLVAACPNHMNSALSYIDPSRVGTVRVFAGITPVSVGGDSIGGTIQVESAAPEFAEPDGQRAKGQIGSFYRSNGNGRGGNLSASFATERLSLSVNGSTARQDNHRAARDFKPAAPGTEGGPVIPGDVVASSAFVTRNQDIGLAWRQDGQLLQLTVGRQQVDFEGFPNQRMDMTDNRSTQVNLRYAARFDGGELLLRAYQQQVAHAMDMGPDRYQYGFGMPMNTESTTRGGLLQGNFEWGEAATLRLGAEVQTYVLYDWWPPVGGSMGPNDFWNVDYGRRNKADVFAEWESTWSPQWLTLIGVRGSRVITDAGPVQGYDNGLGAIWGNEAAAFNAQPRRRTDGNWDLALLARHTPDDQSSYELGVAHKTRSPNLYQRYAWSTQPMAALMNNFVGDGNGYIGDLNLKPEAADTVALTAGWHDARREDWELQITGYLTEVRDFMDARRCDFGQCSADNVTTTDGFVLLQYVNQRARLHGMDLSGRMQLLDSESLGRVSGSLVVNLVRGRNRTTGDNLYNMMPPNARLALQQQSGGWTATAEWQVVAAKTRLSQVRNEMRTGGYALVNLRASHEWPSLRLEAGIDNLFDRFHAPPLGGAYLGQGRSMTSAGIPWGTPVAGPGRSAHASLKLSF